MGPNQRQKPENLENKTIFHIDVSKLEVNFTIGKDYLIMAFKLSYVTNWSPGTHKYAESYHYMERFRTTEILMVSVRMTMFNVRIWKNISKRSKIKCTV